MNVNLRRGSTLLIAALLITGCSATNKAKLDAQGDLENGALKQVEIGNTAEAKTWVDNAIKADPNDVDLLVAHIEELVRDPQQRSRMGQLGRENALRMSWTAMAEKYLDLYEEISTTRAR